MRINKEYCVTCGGLRSYVEETLTAPAPGPGAKRIQVYPQPINVTVGRPSVDEERVCGCQRTNSFGD